LTILDLDTFTGIPHTDQEYADLRLPDYPGTRRGIKKLLRREKIKPIPRQGRGGGYVYWARDLPEQWRNDIIAHFSRSNQTEEDIRREVSCKEIDAIRYAAAPNYNQIKADKYLALYNDHSHLRGNELKAAIAKHNHDHPEQRSSYQSVKTAFKGYEQCGIVAFLGRYGKNLKKTTVPDEAFAHWKSLVWREGAPAYEFCWKLSVSRYCSTKEQVADFPTCDAFLRRLRKEYTESQIHLARYGQKSWSQKYGYWIDRDYSKVNAGQVWVCDHAQIDDLVTSQKSKAKREKVLAPWYTGWRDFKTSKHFGCLLHEDAPNSDHILQSFYYAALLYGLPETVLIDNGKDFRAKDVTGGRKAISTVKLDAERARNTMALLGIKVQFALPYNPQSKPIERDFRKVKEWFAKLLPGYRGGNVLERPEKLVREIKAGSILSFEEYKPLFDRFITEVLNRMPSRGKALNGLSPDELWNQENPVKKTADKDSLKLCCMRTSKTMVIGRHGIRDGEFGVNYFDEWLWKHPKESVYLRRDPRDFNEAWVFNAKTHEYMGKAFINKQVAAFAETPIEKETLKQAIAIKRRQIRQEKEPGSTMIRQSTEAILEDMANASRLFDSDIQTRKQNVAQLIRTPLDSVSRENREAKKIQYRNHNEERILTGLWVKDQTGKKIQPILEYDSDFTYYDDHRDELIRCANGG